MSTAGRDPKTAARATARSKLGAMDAPSRSAASARIVDALLADPGVAEASTILAYAALPDEPDLGPLIARMLDRGQRVCLPRVDWAARSMDAALVRNWPGEAVESGPGLLQPPPSAPSVPLEEIGVVLVPGVAFDPFGGRVGRGGGFYDRFLDRAPRTGRWYGVAFECQVTERVPMDPHDRALHRLVTEAGLRAARAPERSNDGTMHRSAGEGADPRS